MGQVCDKTTKAGKTASVHLHTHTLAHSHTHTDRHANSVRLRDKREDECVTLEVKSRLSEEGKRSGEGGWKIRVNHAK